ncbi:3-oxoacyl-[acyl-carrier-protein] synthase III C-terminal domain-containing protein, partial [Streptomyces sp. GbtcB7]|uniref:3-oxoacyl-[acyl-carrier-protein] synthase III C-terminal domain-containing protein n=1 Tax=Streptomyces sp. GbtcB7 TaxID=2824752 RepID=UPI00267336ED
AVYQMAEAARRPLDAAGVPADQLAAFIPPQANLRIVGALAKTPKLPAGDVVAQDVIRSGNTTAASIPLAMEDLLAVG